MELTRLSDNVLMNQSGGDSVRTAIQVNAEQVLEFYSGKNGFIVSEITPVQRYVQEEFINYGHELDIPNFVMENHLEIFHNVTDVDIIETGEAITEVLVNNKYVVRLENDRVYLRL